MWRHDLLGRVSNPQSVRLSKSACAAVITIAVGLRRDRDIKTHPFPSGFASSYYGFPFFSASLLFLFFSLVVWIALNSRWDRYRPNSIPASFRFVLKIPWISVPPRWSRRFFASAFRFFSQYFFSYFKTCSRAMILIIDQMHTFDRQRLPLMFAIKRQA